LRRCLLLTTLTACLISATALPSWSTPSPSSKPSSSANLQVSSDPLTAFVYKLCRKEFPAAKALEKAKWYTPRIQRAAADADLPATVVASVIWHESNFHPHCVSPCGALGLMQVMPFHFRRGEDWRDPEVNLRVGCRVLKGYWKSYGGDPHRALTAYCWGPANVNRGMSRSRYSKAVLGH
jgi:soluble lytic murein transglycosylase-like protein